MLCADWVNETCVEVPEVENIPPAGKLIPPLDIVSGLTCVTLRLPPPNDWRVIGLELELRASDEVGEPVIAP